MAEKLIATTINAIVNVTKKDGRNEIAPGTTTDAFDKETYDRLIEIRAIRPATKDETTLFLAAQPKAPAKVKAAAAKIESDEEVAPARATDF